MSHILREKLRRIIFAKSFVQGSFTLASGQTSDHFFDLKKTVLDPKGVTLIAESFIDILNLKKFQDIEAVGGVATGGIPIVAVMASMTSNYVDYAEHGKALPAFFVRGERKGHGTESLIEGNFQSGMKVVLIEDVITTGGSVIKAVNNVRAEGGIIDTVLTVVDRLQGGKEALEAVDIKLISLYTKENFR